MNGPFMSFGALMALLTLAMFAVSSTGRSTRVQPPASDNRRTSFNRYAGQGQQIAAMGRERLQRSMGSENDKSCLTGLENGKGDHQPFVFTRIEVAENRIDSGPHEELYCQSEYDSVYDRAVYGSMTSSSAARAGISQSVELPPDGQSELVIFRSLLADRSAPTTRRASARPLPAKSPVGWAEYADFMIGLNMVADVSAAPLGLSDAKASVRSGDWLRHSAASGLSRVARSLEAAAAILTASNGSSTQ